MTRYVLFKECGRTDEAVKLRDLLVEHGIELELRNESLERDVPRLWTQIWVSRDQFDKATEIAKRFA